MHYTCLHCQKEFKVKQRATRKFCSRECYRAYEKVHGSLQPKVEGTEFTCQNCNKKFVWLPGKLNSYMEKYGRGPLYCTIKCSGEGRRRINDEKLASKSCAICGKPMTRLPSGSARHGLITCSRACRAKWLTLNWQKNHPDQEITKRIASRGYVRLRVPGSNGNPSYEILEHRYVMEKKLGRKLLPHETIHHRDGDRANNTEANIELFSSRHGPGQRVIDKVQWAIELLQLYPQFAADQGFRLIKTNEAQISPLL